MPGRDHTDDMTIAKFDDTVALADAIVKNLYNSVNDGSEKHSVNVSNGHVIEHYIKKPRKEPAKTHRNSVKEKKSADKIKDTSSAPPVQPRRRSIREALQKSVSLSSDPDLFWLDDPQTLALERKLQYCDSVTFVDNLARIFSSPHVTDVMKKVRLVAGLITSADRVQYPVFAVDRDGKVIAWNKAMERITSVPAHEMMGKGNYAYATPFYGIPRPMLIDYLLLPPPCTDNGEEDFPSVNDDVLSGKEEMVRIRGKPKIISCKGTRIYDGKGTIVAAIQSIGIHDPPSEMTMSGAGQLRTGGKTAYKTSPGSPLSKPADSFLPASASLAGNAARNHIRLSPQVITEQGSTGQFVSRKHQDLHDALGQLMETEDDLLRNIKVLARNPVPLNEANRKSRPSEEFYGNIIMDAREGIIVYDTDLQCILWNTFMEQLTGISAAEVIGKRAFDMFPALKDAGACLLLEQALSGKSVESSDISFHIPRSAKQAWVRLIFSALYDNSGNIVGIIGIVQDTTARKVMEYALQTTIIQLMESEEKYRNIFNAKNDPLLLIDTASRSILDLNDASSDLYGYTREEFVTHSLFDLFSEPEKYDDLLQRQEPGIRLAHQRKKDGTIFPADLSFAYFELKGSLILILSVRDLTLVHQTADALRLANTKLNLLIGITRHDVINNLTVLMGYNDLLKNNFKDGKIHDMLSKEETALQAIHRLIEFTREYNNLGVKSPLWQNICDISQRTYSQFINTISVTCDTADLEIYADPLLEKVFYTLFDNAFRHGENLTRIRIYFAMQGSDLLLFFGDDGQGIPKENKERIFHRGFGKNTGLGLFLTREILAITGIEITETGEYEKGARFQFRIPAGSYRFVDSKYPENMVLSETMDQPV
jgi:PAS domain S-box-containing protein